jgi:hypothetical protein
VPVRQTGTSLSGACAEKALRWSAGSRRRRKRRRRPGWSTAPASRWPGSSPGCIDLGSPVIRAVVRELDDSRPRGQRAGQEKREKSAGPPPGEAPGTASMPWGRMSTSRRRMTQHRRYLRVGFSGQWPGGAGGVGRGRQLQRAGPGEWTWDGISTGGGWRKPVSGRRCRGKWNWRLLVNYYTTEPVGTAASVGIRGRGDMGAGSSGRKLRVVRSRSQSR